MNKADLYVESNLMQSQDSAQTLKDYGTFLSWSEDERILDVGSGPGNVTKSILMPYLPISASLTGCDISDEMVNYANRNYSNERLDFKKMDIENNCIWDNWNQNTFDKVFSFYCLHWVQNQRQALQNIHSLLKPDGEIFLVFLAKSPVYLLYEKLSKDPQWKQCMKEVYKYISPYYKSDDPALEYAKLLLSMKFEKVKTWNMKTSFTFPSKKCVIRSILAVNPFINGIQKDLQEEYIKAIENITFKEIANVIEIDEETGKVKVPYILIVAVAKKQAA